MNHSQCYETYTSLDNVKRCISEGHYVMVLMRGVAGSGKSFLAKKLLSLKGEGVILSTDDHFMVNGEYKFNQGKLDEYHKKTLQNAKTAIQDCKKLVIIDNTNIQVQHMRSYANYAATDGFEIYVVEPNNEWSRKAGQCALRNQHGVSKEQIKNCLDQLDIEQNPTLRDLVPKNYTISLMPPMDLDDEPIYTSTPLKQALSPGPPCGLPGTSTSSMFSLAHKPKPTIERVNMREMGTQSTDVIVALTSCGLADLFEEDVGEVFERERPVARGEFKERPVQAPTDSKNILPEPCEDLDLLVSIYPGEDMASLQHFYEMCGLSQTIQMNLDSGIMPDYTTDVVKGAFDPDIAKALQSGSFEPEARIDNSDANTSTTDSDYHSRTLNDQIHVVDIGPNLVGQLEDIFGPIPTGSKSTTINISEQILRELYEAVIHHRTFDPTDITENDALLAQQLQEAENEAGSYQPAVLDALSQAQYLGFQQLKADFPGYNETDLKEFFKNCGYNTSMTRDFLNGHEARPMPSKTSMIAAPQTRTMFSLAPKVKGRGSGSTSPAPYNRNHVTDLGMEEAQRRAKEKIDESNEYKRKKDELMREVHMQSSNGKYYKNATADTRRAKAREYDKKEKAARADADAILREANRNSKILDLHYFTYSEALKLVKSRLQLEDRPENKRRGQSNRKLTIVTGHGQSTGGTGVVRKQIENYISSRDYKYYYENRGCIVVQCK